MSKSTVKCPNCGTETQEIVVNNSSIPKTIHATCRKCHKPVIMTSSNGKLKIKK